MLRTFQPHFGDVNLHGKLPNLFKEQWVLKGNILGKRVFAALAIHFEDVHTLVFPPFHQSWHGRGKPACLIAFGMSSGSPVDSEHFRPDLVERH